MPVVVEVRRPGRIFSSTLVRVSARSSSGCCCQDDRTIRKTAGFLTARSTEMNPLTAEMRVLDTDNEIGYSRILRAVACESMSSTLLSFPPIPRPTMLMNVSTRVLDRRRIFSR